ncbi:hypothetical protein BAUCODRAFT_93700, partial [Baudoinia panamericana UAMH 10762]
MAQAPMKRRRGDDEARRPKKKFKKQAVYHSDSDGDDSGDERDAHVQLAVGNDEIALRVGAADVDVDVDEDEDADEDDEPALDAADDTSADEDNDDDENDEANDTQSETSLTSSQASLARRKRNDPSAFATSISAILSTKLSTSKRADPVLSRSKSAADANRTLADQRLEQKARAQIRSERKQALDKGRIKDVLGLETEGVETGAVLEEEKRLKRIAQKGVVRLFNAVRAAQVKGEEARREARAEGVVGVKQREERVSEMTKQGFLDLISSGG